MGQPKTNFALNGIFERIAGMDLFAPDTAVNTYGARDRKKLATGKITDKSYVPAGLTAEQYAKIRGADAKKKAGVFGDYTEFYKQRGTDTNESWSKSVTKGHRMAKTKYDWSGSQDNPEQVGLTAKPKAVKKKSFFGK